MTPELAGAISIALMRIGFAFLPVSLNRFAFNEQTETEAKEAINAVGTRALIVTWLPTTMAMAIAIAAAKGDNAVRFVPLVILMALCVAVPYALWKLMPLDRLRQTRTAIIVVCVMTAADFLFLVLGQDKVIELLLVNPGG